MSEDRPMIHVRLSKALIRQIDFIGVDMGLDRAKTIENLLTPAVESYRMTHETPPLAFERKEA